MSWRTKAISAALLVGPVLAVIACGPPDHGEIVREPTTGRARLDDFETYVSPVFEKHCGSLDCHGQIGRNLRIYSSDGLRLPNDAGARPGTGDTTSAERLANYQSILGLEPSTTRIVLEGGDPQLLLVLKKPLALEKHKGGQQIHTGDDTDRCIVSWFTESPPDAGSQVDTDACGRAVIFPKE